MILAALSLHGLFTDHMVLQRGRANPVWGSDAPRQEIVCTVESAQQQRLVEIRTTVGADGQWRVECPELAVGGPYRLRLKGTTEVIVEDVLVGDVWVASGQSNMEWPLARTKGSEGDVAKADLPTLRVVKVARRASSNPEADVSTQWAVSSPAVAANFSAVGFYFAREIQQRTHVPIGIIDSSWGGTRVEAWVSQEALRPVWPGVSEELKSLTDSSEKRTQVLAEYREKSLAWERKVFPIDTGDEGSANGWAGLGFDDTAWRAMTLPAVMQTQGFEGNGAVWFRRKVEVPAAWAGKDLTLNLGAIDDFDTTFFNGEKIGATGEETPDAYQINRSYRVPARLVKAGTNVIAVRVFDRFGEGGINGVASRMQLTAGAATPAIALAGPWRWSVERQIPVSNFNPYASAPVRPLELNQENAPTYLFNGMIAPLIPFGVRGFIWYQGEANVGHALEYRERFSAMIRDWRARWGEGTLPFYFVQLAGFKQSEALPYLREAQALTLIEPRTGMATAIDIGDANNIHPANKIEVGRRLARVALADSYGQDIEAQGPTLQSVRIAGPAVTISWIHGSGLKTRTGSTSVNGFALAGADGVYHDAQAAIVNGEVTVTSPEVPAPRTVRYAWSDYAELNLENEVGLPALPFRTDAF